jgi:O-antigen/teichoic acid export membrane protein
MTKGAASSSSSLGPKIMAGALWNTVQLVTARGTSLLVKLVLTRLLLPKEFGIVGMAAIFIDVLGVLSDLGLAAALIQFKQQKTSRTHYDTAFWASLAFSGVIALSLAFLVGPFAAWFFGEPLLQTLIPILGLGTLLRSLGLIHRVLLTRDLNFKPIGIAETISAASAGVIAIALAVAGAGVWALVVQDLAYILISLPFLWRGARWRPGLRFSKSAFTEIFGVGSSDMFLRLITFFTKNIDYLLVGKLLGAELLGTYTLAFVLTDFFRQQVWAVFSNVMFPVYSQLQDDLVKVKDYYLRVIRYNSLVITALMLPLIYYSGFLVPALFGEPWLQAILPIRILALSAVLLTVGGTPETVLRGLGRFSLNLRLTLISVFFFAVPAFSIGIYFFGINGAALAVLTYQTLSRILYQLHMQKLIGVSAADILRAARPTLLGTAATLPILVISFFFPPNFSPGVLAVLVAATELTYASLVFLLNKVEIIDLLHMISVAIGRPVVKSNASN